MGEAGIAGIQGIQGIQGLIGEDGLDGLAGLAGLDGDDGANGLDGADGTDGLAGLDGPAGLDGDDGADGLAGTNGLAGADGADGLAGADGADGAPGVDGTDGAPGADGLPGAPGADGNRIAEYAYVYNLTAQTVAIEADIPFDSEGVMTAGFVHTANASEIQILNPGIYKVAFSVSGTETSQMAVFVNGVVVEGSIYGSGAGTQQNNGQVIVAITAPNSLLTIRNYMSSAAVGLASVIGGTQANVNASVLIEQLD